VVFQSKKRHEFHVVTNDTAIYGMSSVIFLAGIFSVGKTVSTTNKKTLGKKIGPQQKSAACLFVFHLFSGPKMVAQNHSQCLRKISCKLWSQRKVLWRQPFQAPDVQLEW